MGDAILILDAGGRIVWANRQAHANVSAAPGEVIGRNYLEFCPPDTHADLLDLHRRKLEGESVRFRMEFRGKVLTVTSGPVSVGGRTYLYSVARPARGRPAGDETLIGMLAAGELLRSQKLRTDLNACLLGALRDEASLLKGRIRLDPQPMPAVRARPWPLRVVLRRILRSAASRPGRIEIDTGRDARKAWIRFTLASPPDMTSAEMRLCRRILREQGGALRVRGRQMQILFEA